MTYDVTLTVSFDDTDVEYIKISDDTHSFQTDSETISNCLRDPLDQTWSVTVSGSKSNLQIVATVTNNTVKQASSELSRPQKFKSIVTFEEWCEYNNIWINHNQLSGV